MIITQTPLRVSFFGGGTDFPDFYEKYGGCVLSTAINKYVYVIVIPRFDNNIRVTYTKAELVKNVNDVKHDIVRECLKHVKIEGGIEVITIGDVPAGTGLGSSSAVTVGLLKALYAFKGIETNAKQLAEEACHIEIDILKKPIGVQDQYASAFGGFKFYSFEKGKVGGFNVPPDDLQEHLLLLYTGITRESSTILKVQKKNVSKNSGILKKMKGLALESIHWIDKEGFGKLLGESWGLKRQLAEDISNDKIERWFAKAEHAGATGGKVLGAGGGGFLLLYCPDGTKEAVRNALKLVEMPFEFEPNGSKVMLNI
jgi:D-glycero-alpha-D-manno-heptose-7-phosphate kinase